jgi:hypothetical protein
MGIYKTMDTTGNITILCPASPEQTQALARAQGALIFDLRPQRDEALRWTTIWYAWPRPLDEDQMVRFAALAVCAWRCYRGDAIPIVFLADDREYADRVVAMVQQAARSGFETMLD